MKAIELIQIVPNLPPTICGVADHAFALAESLHDRHGVRTSFLVTGNAKIPDSYAFPFQQLIKKNEHEMVHLLSSMAQGQAPTVLLLHFSGYSYATRGLCFWLVRALKLFRELRPDVPIVTMFHELWASGPWLSSAIYVQPLQKAIVRSLIDLCHSCHTNRFGYAKSIIKTNSGKAVVALPIFSNFGEPSALPAWESRKDQIILFQPPTWKKGCNARFWKGLRLVLEKLNSPSIIVAGRTRELPSGFKLDIRGILPKEDVSRLLLESKYCYYVYYDGYLGKSSLLGGMAAHGVSCIMPNRNRSEEEGLYCGLHYVSAEENKNWESLRMQDLGTSLNQWYSAHRLSATADRYAKTLNDAVSA